MNNLLLELYRRSKEKYVKYHRRLKRGISEKPTSLHSRRHLKRNYNKLQKYRSQTNGLALQLKVGSAAALAITALSGTGTEGQAQGLGPFTQVTDRASNPLYPPVIMPQNYLSYPNFADFDMDGDVDMMVSSRTSGNYYELLPYSNYLDTKGWHMIDYGGSPPFSGYTSFTRMMWEFVDIDNDGDLDAFSPWRPSAVAGLAVLWMRNDAGTFVAIPSVNPINPFNGGSISSRSISFVDLDGDGDDDAMANGMFFRNQGTPFVPDFEYEYGHPLQLFGSVAHVAWLDIDGDGDYDILHADPSGAMHFWRNNNTTPAPNMQTQNFTQDDSEPLFAPMDIDNDGYEVIPQVVDFDGDGDDDVIITEVGSANGETYVNFIRNDFGTFNRITGFESPFGGTGRDVRRTAPALTDIDDDGDLDAFIGTESDGIRFYENLSESYTSARFIERTGVSNPLSLLLNNTFPELVDIDGDNDMDAFVGTENNFFFFRNYGTPSSPAFGVAPSSLITEIPPSIDEYFSPALGDLDNDGDFDAVVGSGGYTIGYNPVKVDNTGTPLVENFVYDNQISTYLGYRRLDLADIDHDGDADLMAGSSIFSNGQIRFFENFSGSFVEQITDNPFTNNNYEFTTPNIIDWDGDGDLDLFMGEQYGEIHFFENTNAPLTVGINTSTITYNENDAPTPITSFTTIIDPDVIDNASASQATVTIGNYVNGEDILSFTDQPNLTEVWNPASGTLTATGNASFLEYRDFINSVTYQNTSEDPSTTTRLIRVQIWDSDFTDPIPASKNINIVSVNDPPQATVGASGVTWTEGGGAIVVDGLFTATDNDHANLSGATIQITGNLASGEDQLLFTNQNGITGTYTAATGTLALSGSSSVSNYRTAIRTIQYNNSNNNPSTATRTVSFTLNDGVENGNTDTQTITIVSTNDLPVVSGGPTNIPYVFGSGAVAITPPDFSITDIDDTNISGGSVTITNNYTTGAEQLAFTDGGTVGGSWNSGAGAFNLSGTWPIVEYENALNTITYQYTSGSTTYRDRTLEVLVRDGQGGINNPPLSFTIELPPAQSMTAAPAAFVEDAGAISIDPAYNVIDDQPTIDRAQITIGNYINGEDILNFTDQNGISGTFIAATGILNLTGTSSVLNYRNAIRSITYNNLSDTPDVTTRSISVVVTRYGGTFPSPVVSRNVTVTAVNDQPVITSTAPTTATEDTPYTYTATVNDPDDANDGINLTWGLSGAPAGMLVSTTGAVTWSPPNGVTTSGPVTLSVQDGGEDGTTVATEVFTITVTPVNDQPTITSSAPTTATEDVGYVYNAVVVDPDDANDGTNLLWGISGAPPGMNISTTGQVTWTPTEGVTTSGSVTITVQDGGEDGTVPVSEVFTISVTPVNDGPVITSTAGTGATEDVLYTYNAVVADPDDANDGVNLTWSLSGEPAGMTVSSTGVVTWTPPNGVTTSGAVTLTVQDGGEDGAPAFSEVFTISVTAVNEGPTITSTAPITATEDIPWSYTPIVNDPDDANDGVNLTWTISGEPAGMTQSPTGVINWTPGEGVTSAGPITITVADGGEDGATPDVEIFTIAVAPINDPPIIASSAPTTGTEDVAYSYTPVVSDPDDANDGTNLTWSLSGAPAGMTISSTGVINWIPLEGVTSSGPLTLTVQDGGENGASPDVENFTITVTPVNDPPTITSTAGAAAIELTPYTYTATVSDPDDANDGVNLTWSLSGEPAGMVVSSTGVVTWTPPLGTTTSGSVTLTVQDGGEDGSTASAEIFIIAVVPANDPPVISPGTLSINYNEGAGLVTIDPSLSISDDGADLEGALVSISNWQPTEDNLTFNTSAQISGSFNSGSGVLTLTGTAPINEYRSALRSIQYENTSESPNTSNRVVQMTVDDIFVSSAPVSYTISVVSINDVPVVNDNASSLDVIPGDPPVAPFPGIDVSDLDSDLTSATVTIASGFVAGEDILTFTPSGGITGSYNASTGILTLTGTAPPAAYQAVLRTVLFQNTGSSITPTTRSISVEVTDGTDTSTPSTLTINVSSTDLPPAITVTGSATYTENSGPVVLDTGLTITDDTPDLQSGTVTITNFVTGEDQLVFTDQNGITGFYDAITGQLSMSGTSSQANWQTALASVAYENTSDNPNTTDRDIVFVVFDGISSSPDATLSLSIAPVNDLPVVSGSSVDLTYDAQSSVEIIDGSLQVTDLDDSNLVGAEIEITGNYASGEDVLHFTTQNGISGSFDNAIGMLTLSGTATVADYSTALASVAFENLGLSNPSNKTIQFRATDAGGTGTGFDKIIRVNPTVVSLDDFAVNAEIGTAITINVASRATAGPTDVLTLTIDVDPIQGSATLSGTDITYTANNNASGTDAIEITLCNQFGSCSQNIIMVTIVNDNPTFTSTAANAIPGQQASINLLDLIDDINGNIDPNSLRIVENPTSGAVASISGGILVIDYQSNPFVGFDHLVVEVCDFSGACVQTTIDIILGEPTTVVVFNAVSPNGDGLHDFLHLEDIDLFASNVVTIYDKSGQLVYSVENYNNNDVAFDGTHRDGSQVPSGTYYFVVELTSGSGTKSRQSGYFVLNR